MFDRQTPSIFIIRLTLNMNRYIFLQLMSFLDFKPLKKLGLFSKSRQGKAIHVTKEKLGFLILYPFINIIRDKE